MQSSLSDDQGSVSLYSGDNYFGQGNRDCLCLTCELNHRGGFSRVGNENASSATNGDNITEPSNYLGAMKDSSDEEAESGDLQLGMTVNITYEDGTGASTETIEVINASDGETNTDEDMPLGRGGWQRSSHEASRKSGRRNSRAPSKQPSVENGCSMSGFLQSQDANKRYPRRSGSSSAIPQRMADSVSVSSSTRNSPTPSSSAMDSTRPASRNSRRAAVRGRERTSNMIHNPFGATAGKNGKRIVLPSDGMEHLMDPTHAHDDDEDPPGTIRCTVCLTVMEPVWISDRYIEQCSR